MVLVLDLDAARNRKSYQVRCLLFAGDHPACRVIERVSPEPVTKGDFYLVIEGRALGFRSSHSSQATTARGVNYARRTTLMLSGKNGPAKLKSFERGHIEHDQAITDALTSWLS